MDEVAIENVTAGPASHHKPRAEPKLMSSSKKKKKITLPVSISGWFALRRQGRDRRAVFLFQQLPTTITAVVHVKLCSCWVQAKPPQNAQGDNGIISD